MPAIDFFDQSKRDPDNTAVSPARLVNCYRERVDGRSPYVLKPVLGMTAFATLEGVFCRAIERIGVYLYAVHGGALWRVSQGGSVLNCGAVPDSEDTSISGNNGKVAVVSGGLYYVWDGTTLTNIVAGAFDAFGSVIFAGQLTILTERAGRRVQWSNAADPNTLNALNFATTEQRDDRVLRGFAVGGEIWFFKETSIERWYVTAAGPVFQGGGLIERGLKSFRLITQREGGVFFVGADNKAYLAGAGAMQPVSNIAVETSIKTEGPKDCLYYQEEGHEFCAITFNGRPAWVYDISMGEWHERAQDDGAWTVNAMGSAWGDYYGVTSLGQMVRMAASRADLGRALAWDATGATVQMDGRRFRVVRLEFQGKVGAFTVDYEVNDTDGVMQITGNDVVQATAPDDAILIVPAEGQTDPEIMFYWSKNHGKTWNGPRNLSVGSEGEHDKKLIIRSLGQFTSFTPRFRFTEPFGFTLDSTAFLEIA